MRYFNSILLISALFLTFSCKENNAVEPEPEPSAPVVESASLRGPEGETSVTAGSPVVFTANVSVKDSELETYTLEVRKGTEMIASVSGNLSGTTAVINETLELAINATALAEEFYPDVVLKVTNTDEMFSEKALSKEESVRITVMELPDKLYLIDNAGHSYEMAATSERGKYRTSGDISGIGSAFSVASKVTDAGAADPAGQVWENLQTPVSDYGLKWIGFDMVSEEVYKMINHTVTLDMTAMADDNPYKVFWNQAFVQDCEVVFSNYPDGMQLQGDRFADAVGNTARYTGQTKDNFEAYYLPDVNWFVLKYQWSDVDSMWLTGEEGSLPMSPYTEGHPLNWFSATFNAENSTSHMSLVKEDENNWRLLMYLKESFGIKVYATAPSWANEVSPWTSLTPETLVISELTQDPETGAVDGNYGNAGTSFTEGLYMLHFNSSTSEASLERYTGSIPAISVK